MGKTIDDDLPDQTTVEPKAEPVEYKKPVYVNTGGLNPTIKDYSPRKYADVGGLNAVYEFNKIRDAISSINPRFDHDVIAECGSEIVGTVKVRKYPQTDDRYTWFAGLYFKDIPNAPGAEIAILLPYVHNSKSKLEGGSALDRSISVYTKGNIPKTSLDSVVRMLEYKFKEVAEALGGD
jgi:hypothetical protein